MRFTKVGRFLKSFIVETRCIGVKGVVVNDGGFVVEMASLMILLLIVAIVVFVGYSFFKAVNRVYKDRKARGQPDEDSSKQNEGES